MHAMHAYMPTIDVCRWEETPKPLTKVFTKDMDSETEAEIVAFLDKIEAVKDQLFGEQSGPHLFGEFSLADITVAPFLPIIMESNRDAVNLSRHPHVKQVRFHLCPQALSNCHA
jgi:glutathione S-transferase